MLIFQNKLIRNLLGGALGGLVAWILSEPVFAFAYDPMRIRTIEQMLVFDAMWAVPIGLALGLVLGAAEGLSLRSLALTVRGALIGMFIGLVGGTIGVVIAELVFQQVQWCCFIGRGIGWSIFGLFLGTSEGIRRFSLLGARNAAIGGAIGGFIGGVLFDLVAIPFMILSFTSGGRETGTFSRGIALIVLGACIGILIALVERALAEGALRVIAGRQEGREILLDKPRITFGHDERNDVYMSDMGIAPRHAEIRAEGGGYAIVPLNGTVLVNHAQVTHNALQPGDEIQIGAAQMRYRARKRGAGVSQPVASLPRAPKDLSGFRNLTGLERLCPRCAHANRACAKFCSRCGQAL